MARTFGNIPKEKRPRSFWLRGLALCWVLLMFEFAILAGLMMSNIYVHTPDDNPKVVVKNDILMPNASGAHAKRT